MNHEQQAEAMRTIAAAMHHCPARQVTVSASGAHIIASTPLAARRWKAQAFPFPVEVFVWRSLESA